MSYPRMLGGYVARAAQRRFVGAPVIDDSPGVNEPPFYQGSSIKTRVYQPSSARIRYFSHIVGSGSNGAPNSRDNLCGAPHAIPVSQKGGGR